MKKTRSDGGRVTCLSLKPIEPVASRAFREYE
jgi:hypothetical protein